MTALMVVLLAGVLVGLGVALAHADDETGGLS